MREWWFGLEARERRMLIIGGIALAVIFYYFVLWLPPHRAVAELRQTVASQRETLAWMRQAAAEARSLQGSAKSTNPSTGGQALYALADRTARGAGLGDAIQRVEPSGDNQVRVTLQNAGFDDMVRWLAQLKRRYGITATPVSIRAAEQPGQVNVQLVLVEGGGA